MHNILKIFRRIVENSLQLRWSSIIIYALIHAFISRYALWYFGEQEIAQKSVDFIYFYIVTASTVGYGDFSPTTDAGKMITSLFIIPGSITIFALIITKISTTVINTMRKIMNGLGDYTKKTGHIVIIGYNETKTPDLLKELDCTKNHEIVLMTQKKEDIFLPNITLVRAPSLSSREDLMRAGVKGAEAVIVYGETDQETMSACLAVGTIRKENHVVAYFETSENAKLIEAHFNHFECVTSTAIGQVSRALMDPGAGRVLERLSSRSKDATIHSTMIEDEMEPISIEKVASKMLSYHKASVVAFRKKGEISPDLTFDPDDIVHTGDTIYYVATKRLGSYDVVFATMR